MCTAVRRLDRLVHEVVACAVRENPDRRRAQASVETTDAFGSVDLVERKGDATGIRLVVNSQAILRQSLEHQ